MKEQLNGDCPNRNAHGMLAFVLYEWLGAGGVPFFCVGVSVGRAEHSLAGAFQTKAAACAWIETQTTIGQAMASP